jgi:hypothetical protein
MLRPQTPASENCIQWNHYLHEKAVPLHAIMALGGWGGIAPTHSLPRHKMGVSGQRHAQAALCPGERTSGTHCTGGWVGLRAGLDTEARGNILCPCQVSNLDRPVVQSLVRHYTDWATPVPIYMKTFSNKSSCKQRTIFLIITVRLLFPVVHRKWILYQYRKWFTFLKIC